MDIVDFACKRVSINQIIRCSFGLKKLEFDVLRLLLNAKKECEVLKIAKRVKKDRTTVQRALNNLIKKGLIRRRQINLEHGGYLYVYSCVGKDIIKQKIKGNFDNWAGAVLREIEKW